MARHRSPTLALSGLLDFTVLGGHTTPREQENEDPVPGKHAPFTQQPQQYEQALQPMSLLHVRTRTAQTIGVSPKHSRAVYALQNGCFTVTALSCCRAPAQRPPVEAGLCQGPACDACLP